MRETGPAGEMLLDSLRQHVLAPPEEAESLVRAEREAVEAERDAFERFRERLDGIPTASSREAPRTRQAVARSGNAERTDRLRNLYRETVMGVEHYEGLYGESLDEHVAGELSAEVATGFQRNGTPFTDVYKRRLRAAVDQAVDQREALCECLETEADSLATCRESLSALLDSLDGPRVPTWHATEFEDDLASLATQRQETMRTRERVGPVDGHDLCAYLYDEPEWTYPVLTAIARFRTAVDCRPDGSDAASGSTSD